MVVALASVTRLVVTFFFRKETKRWWRTGVLEDPNSPIAHDKESPST